MTPLARVGSIKLKLGVVIVAGVVASDVVALWLFRQGLPLWLSGLGAIVVALLIVQVLARGLTQPLRAMARAARAMARGEYGTRVEAAGQDEVGELARAFNAMAAELAETDRMRRDLVANVSHELRTPIAALQARLENLADGVEEPEPETVRTMLAQVERLGRLVAQLLDLSRLESQGQPFDVAPFPVAPVLEQAAREARLHAPDGVEVAVVGDGADAVAVGDADRIAQVVANLVENAVRHSPRPGRVELAAAPVAEEGRVQIVVADEGPGIPPAEAERVFERFYRADVARGNGGGAGLGLAIARWIVDLHGGAIRVDGGAPSGCRMVVELPAA
jgi:signal transduction histidine kinase